MSYRACHRPSATLMGMVREKMHSKRTATARGRKYVEMNGITKDIRELVGFGRLGWD